MFLKRGGGPSLQGEETKSGSSDAKEKKEKREVPGNETSRDYLENEPTRREKLSRGGRKENQKPNHRGDSKKNLPACPKSKQGN